MSNPNINLSNLDARYATPSSVDTMIATQPPTRRQSGRVSAPFTVATTAPTISYPTDTGQAIITNYKTISLNPTTAPVTFLGAGGFTLSGSSYAPTSLSIAMGTANDDASHPNPRSQTPFSLLFGFDGAVLVVQIVNKGPAYYRIRVDDQYVSSVTPTSVASDGSWHLLTIDFTSAGGAKPRKIRIDFCDHEVISLRTGPTDTVWPISPRGPRVMALGDSYTGGAGPGGSAGLSTWLAYMADVMGWDDYWNSGIGGTGFITSNNAIYGGGPKFRDRLATDVVPYNPGVLIIAGGHNDAPGTALQTECQTLFTAARAALPNARVIVVGPWTSGGTVSAYIPKQANVAAAVSACAPGVVDQMIDTMTNPWFTGTGYATSLQNDGNSDIYIGSDNTHPTEPGHSYLGYRMAQAINSALLG